MTTVFAPDDPRAIVVRKFSEWALSESPIEGVLLIGSHASGAPRADSDIDLVVLTERGHEYVARTEWLQQCGEVLRQAVEHYGAVQSVRATFVGAGEFEFGFALPSWANVDPVDPGTKQVMSGGTIVLIDKHGRLSRLRDCIQNE